jgi:hypothetical protein
MDYAGGFNFFTRIADGLAFVVLLDVVERAGCALSQRLLRPWRNPLEGYRTCMRRSFRDYSGVLLEFRVFLGIGLLKERPVFQVRVRLHLFGKLLEGFVCDCIPLLVGQYEVIKSMVIPGPASLVEVSEDFQGNGAVGE